MIDKRVLQLVEIEKSSVDIFQLLRSHHLGHCRNRRIPKALVAFAD